MYDILEIMCWCIIASIIGNISLIIGYMKLQFRIDELESTIRKQKPEKEPEGTIVRQLMEAFQEKSRA